MLKILQVKTKLSAAALLTGTPIHMQWCHLVHVLLILPNFKLTCGVMCEAHSVQKRIYIFQINNYDNSLWTH